MNVAAATSTLAAAPGSADGAADGCWCAPVDSYLAELIAYGWGRRPNSLDEHQVSSSAAVLPDAWWRRYTSRLTHGFHFTTGDRLVRGDAPRLDADDVDKILESSNRRAAVWAVAGGHTSFSEREAAGRFGTAGRIAWALGVARRQRTETHTLIDETSNRAVEVLAAVYSTPVVWSEYAYATLVRVLCRIDRPEIRKLRTFVTGQSAVGAGTATIDAMLDAIDAGRRLWAYHLVAAPGWTDEQRDRGRAIAKTWQRRGSGLEGVGETLAVLCDTSGAELDKALRSGGTHAAAVRVLAARTPDITTLEMIGAALRDYDTAAAADAVAAGAANPAFAPFLATFDGLAGKIAAGANGATRISVELAAARPDLAGGNIGLHDGVHWCCTVERRFGAQVWPSYAELEKLMPADAPMSIAEIAGRLGC